MYYALSDLHGCYDLYAAMLDEINFSERDTLFFLGDAADRGPDGIEIMEDLRSRPNVVYLLGNHEDMFRRTAHRRQNSQTRLFNRQRAYYLRHPICSA